MFRAVILYASGLSTMRHSIAEKETPELAFYHAAEEFFGTAILQKLTWQPSSGIVFYDGIVPCGCVFKVEK